MLYRIALLPKLHIEINFSWDDLTSRFFCFSFSSGLWHFTPSLWSEYHWWCFKHRVLIIKTNTHAQLNRLWHHVVLFSSSHGRGWRDGRWESWLLTVNKHGSSHANTSSSSPCFFLPIKDVTHYREYLMVGNHKALIQMAMVKLSNLCWCSLFIMVNKYNCLSFNCIIFLFITDLHFLLYII